jgi:hypothetical protein
MRAREDPARQPFPFPDQAKKEVLGLDRDAAELAGLITGEEQNPSRPFRIAFEHPACLGLEVGGENYWPIPPALQAGRAVVAAVAIALDGTL